LTIGELFEFAQSQYFAQRARHRIKNEASGFGLCFPQGRGFWIILVRRYIGYKLFGITLAVAIDLQTRLSPPVRQPAVIAISHNRENPGAGIPAAISSEASIGSKECLLHDILGPRRHPDEGNARNCGLLELRNDIPLKSGKAMDAYSRIELAPKDQHGVCVT
jgi:hypothetical protein